MKRSELEETPSGRIAAEVHALNEEFADRYAKDQAGPKIPDVADYRERLDLYIKRELLEVEIRTMIHWGAHAEALKQGTHPQVLKLMGELGELNWLIAKRKLK